MVRRIVILIGLIMSAFCCSYAANEVTPIKCIYINGANNNTPAMQKWFFDGINRLHPQIKHYFETSPFVYKTLLRNGKLKIKDKPSTFFWGDKTLKDLQKVQEGLVTTSVLSPYMAQMVRSLFAHCMHDAIWVQKDHNMQSIVRDLHKDIMKAHQDGEKVILFGYSAGSFITYEYLFYKLPAIKWKDISDKLNLPKREQNFVETHKISSTCIDAITQSRLAVYSTSGDLIPNSDFEDFKKAYLNLDKTTLQACVPDNTILGTINYASPLVLFYSDIQDPTIEINRFNKDFFIYMKNHDMFWLTVNFADDPLGYPVTKNLTGSEISDIHNINFKKEGKGFFYDKSDIKSPATFLGAHTSYWKFSKKFAKAVSDAYEEGYLNFYSGLFDDL
ncbi:hypothetical protein IJG14_05660 [bacterium]|nr:hypothetical protein [bacterium]